MENNNSAIVTTFLWWNERKKKKEVVLVPCVWHRSCVSSLPICHCCCCRCDDKNENEIKVGDRRRPMQQVEFNFKRTPKRLFGRQQQQQHFNPWGDLFLHLLLLFFFSFIFMTSLSLCERASSSSSVCDLLGPPSPTVLCVCVYYTLLYVCCCCCRRRGQTLGGFRPQFLCFLIFFYALISSSSSSFGTLLRELVCFLFWERWRELYTHRASASLCSLRHVKAYLQLLRSDMRLGCFARSPDCCTGVYRCLFDLE